MTRLLTGCGVAALAGVASAGVSFTFEDPGTGAEFSHTNPNFPSGPTSQMTFREDLPVDLIVRDDDASPSDAPIATFSVFFEIDWVVDALFTDSGAPVQAASISGGFAWRDATSEEVVLSGAFDDAVVYAFGIAGSIVASSVDGRGGLRYTPGQPLVDAGVPALTGTQDAVWTLTDIRLAGAGLPGGLPAPTNFASFTANAAFTGTAEIPAPGTLALAGLAGLLAVHRRR